MSPAADEVASAPSPSSTPATADYAVFWIGDDGRVTRWSAEAETLFGHSMGESRDLSLQDFFTDADREGGAPDRALESVRRRGVWDGIGWRRTRGGRAFWAATSLARIDSSDGQPLGVMAVVRRLETPTPQEDVLAQANRLAFLGRVASEVSHDVRNVLSAIRGFALVLERRLPEGDTVHQVWHELVKACDRGANLTDRVLGVARSSSSSIGPVGLSETVGELAPMLRQIVPSGVRLDLDIEEDVTPIVARRHDIELAVLNVVVNARDAISGPGTITVRLTEEAKDDDACGRVVLSVCDTGRGMSPDVRSRMFDRFFTTKGSGHGTGLGMAMVRDSVRAAGGSIEIESQEGTGTVVRMIFETRRAGTEVVTKGTRSSGTVPAEEILATSHGRPGPRDAPPVRASGKPDTSATHRDRNVLVWCHSPVLRSAAADLLGRTGFRVQVAPTAERAGELLDESAVDCLIVEGSLEIAEVVGACRTEAGGRRALPVIALVEAGQSESTVTESRADRVLSMPLDPRALCDAVNQLSAGPDGSRASVH